MAHFNFEKSVNELTKLDAPITRGPMMRWQRKALEQGVRHLSVPEVIGGPLSPLKSANCLRTPLSGVFLTPSKDQPDKAKRLNKSPIKRTPSTPSNSQDRFIPNRSTTDTELGHYMLMNNENDNPDDPSKADLKKMVTGDQDSKILSYTQKAPRAAEGHLNNLKVLYSSSSKSTAPKAQTTRHIPSQPERILDAPEILDDYYLNLLDWSSTNLMALALGKCVYLWNAASGDINILESTNNTEEYVSSVSWLNDGNIVAVGLSSGSVQLWDANELKNIRVMTGHAARVGVMDWNSYILSSGSRSGAIHHHDVRVAGHHVGTLAAHTQEVCGLQWSGDGRYLASGGNDNLLHVWDAVSLSHDSTPLHVLSHHQAAVKAVAWCPWQPHLLASGGGTADRHIRFWNITSGTCLHSVDTSSQVCSILWSKSYKELISGHGFSQNQLTIWKYPTMTRIAELTGHTARVLSMKMSPNGSTVASAAGDESVCLWQCFAIDKTKKEVKKTVKSNSILTRGIR